MDVFLMYLWTRLDNVITLFIVSCLALGVATALCFLYGNLENDEAATKLGKSLLKWLVLVACLITVTPNSKEVALIIAGTATYRAITSERGSRLAEAFSEYVEREALRLLKEKK